MTIAASLIQLYFSSVFLNCIAQPYLEGGGSGLHLQTRRMTIADSTTIATTIVVRSSQDRDEHQWQGNEDWFNCISQLHCPTLSRGGWWWWQWPSVARQGELIKSLQLWWPPSSGGLKIRTEDYYFLCWSLWLKNIWFAYYMRSMGEHSKRNIFNRLCPCVWIKSVKVSIWL